MPERLTVAVVGGGAWGTALAQAACLRQNRVQLWARDAAIVQAVNTRHENPRYLAGVPLSSDLYASENLEEVVRADVILLVVPAQSVAQMAQELVPLVAPTVPVIICAKGIEQTSGKRMSEVWQQYGPGFRVGVLSGPSFANDVARGLPTAVTLACREITLAVDLAQALFAPALRLYPSDDVIGVELGGALKNVLAIAAGVVEGRRLGASARAALISRGFAEMSRFARHFGAKPETLMGLSGLGDLVLTASSMQSRNYALGVRLGQGMSIGKASGEKLAEGAHTAHIAHSLAVENAIDMPITATVTQILQATVTVKSAIEQLLSRPVRREI